MKNKKLNSRPALIIYQKPMNNTQSILTDSSSNNQLFGMIIISFCCKYSAQIFFLFQCGFCRNVRSLRVCSRFEGSVVQVVDGEGERSSWTLENVLTESREMIHSFGPQRLEFR